MNALEIGEAIRSRRKHLLMTQEQLAQLASCSKPLVIAAEAGKATLRLDKLLAILNVLGLTLSLDTETE